MDCGRDLYNLYVLHRKSRGSSATEAVPEVYEDILKNENYIEVSLGKCYLGKKIFYDIPNKKTLIEPFEEQKQIILREDENVEVYYGKYRGSENMIISDLCLPCWI